MSQVEVRGAVVGDVPTMNRIYNEYIVDSHVSFDTEPWTDGERRSWFLQRSESGYPVLVAELDGTVIGAAWSGPWRDKAAYRGSVETTGVLDPGECGAGIGTELLTALLDELAASGYHVAISIIALPNDASIALHRKLGYREVGVLHGVGAKDGAFHDTMIMEKSLEPRASSPESKG